MRPPWRNFAPVRASRSIATRTPGTSLWARVNTDYQFRGARLLRTITLTSYAQPVQTRAKDRPCTSPSLNGTCEHDAWLLLLQVASCSPGCAPREHMPNVPWGLGYTDSSVPAAPAEGAKGTRLRAAARGLQLRARRRSWRGRTGRPRHLPIARHLRAFGTGTVHFASVNLFQMASGPLTPAQASVGA